MSINKGSNGKSPLDDYEEGDTIIVRCDNKPDALEYMYYDEILSKLFKQYNEIRDVAEQDRMKSEKSFKLEENIELAHKLKEIIGVISEFSKSVGWNMYSIISTDFN
ncbi:hypothetical protein EIN_325980 [Entamoeba invadens IP1]|uniref:Uncharacterized protein n=1 Tax=Entamoeba invadens IP1 TaxID=370355 RepID=L7FKZ9_ENTIV|nr:hypothetical protein EIN_325980 [Entamoeba invadens IP1]ELP87547.1 hypothetical protein EIN_325980 [Entamoeba invadens IP1]|eukprot:XP_004254318.1 hypothetical protein EIN_325980 [Entamoeba invadens IP1]